MWDIRRPPSSGRLAHRVRFARVQALAFNRFSSPSSKTSKPKWNYLVTSDTTLTYDQITILYRKRWNVEPYRKSLKQNASLEKSPTHTVRTQTNPLFAALCGYIKLERLKHSTKLNHLALKSKLYDQARHMAFTALRDLQPVQLAA